MGVVRDVASRLRVWRPNAALIPAIAGVIAILVYLATALTRLRYPYELEWMEGAMVDHVARILRGDRIYVRPSLEFTPFIYPPLYYYVSAGLARFTGLGFFPLRLVSLGASLGSFTAIGAMVRHETRSTCAALAAAGMFAASYPLSGGWFDIARVDSLALCLLLSAMLVARRWPSATGAAACATLVALAFHTKQLSLLMTLPLAIAFARHARRSVVAFLGIVALLVVVPSVLLDYAHGGWYRYYVFAVVGGHDFAHEMHSIFWRIELLRTCGLACAVTLLFLLTPSRSKHGEARVFFGLCIAGLVGIAWWSRVHSGGWLNVLVPAHAALALGLGLGVHAARHARVASLPYRFGSAVAAIATLQILALAYDPRDFIPTREDKLAGDRFLTMLRATPGEVLLTHRGYLPSLAGKPTFAHHMAVVDVMRSSADLAGAKAGLARAFDDALRAKRFSRVILDNRDPWCMGAIERNYEPQRASLFEGQDVYWARTGAHIRPEWMWTPRQEL